MPLLTYILPNSANRPEQRMTPQEMLLAQIFPETSSGSKYSKGFFRVRTIRLNENEIREADASWYGALSDLLYTEYTKEYIHFRIPKASGGTRHIEAPAPQLKLLQRRIASVLINDAKILPHNAAYAYTRGRCAYDALVTHQRSNARWFLKLDIKDFFPSITADLLIKTIKNIYPLNMLSDIDIAALVNIATNEQGVLPQGSPLSPLLSNLVMTEFDKALTGALFNHRKSTYTYTRYADDLLITSPYDFSFDEITNIVKDTIEKLGLPFEINMAKRRYSSMAGSNWNLGLMYNQDQKITVGNKRKRILHSLLNNFVVDYNSNNLWSVQETQELIGKLGYLKNVEPTYYQQMFDKYQRKYPGLDIKYAFKRTLNNNN